MRLWKTVLHTHTNYSHDSNRSPEELVETALAQGVDAVAVTDHDTIDGAWQAEEAARKLGGVRVIIGQEITTAGGHLIGLFLQDWLPPGRPAEETARAIRQQGGLVLIPHPFATLVDHALGRAAYPLLPWIDAIEVCNSQNPLPWEDRRAAIFARAHGLPGFVGADAHLRGTLARGYQFMPPFEDAASFLASLRQARLVHARFGPWYIARMAYQHFFRRFRGRPAPGFGANVPPAGAAEPREA